MIRLEASGWEAVFFCVFVFNNWFSTSRGTMKLSLILVFVLMFLTSDAKKSKKKKTSASNNLRRLKQLLKGLTIPTQSTVPKTSSTVKPKTNPPDSFKVSAA